MTRSHILELLNLHFRHNAIGGQQRRRNKQKLLNEIQLAVECVLECLSTHFTRRTEIATATRNIRTVLLIYLHFPFKHNTDCHGF